MEVVTCSKCGNIVEFTDVAYEKLEEMVGMETALDVIDRNMMCCKKPTYYSGTYAGRIRSMDEIKDWK